jgi:hypothetical protein
MILAGTSGVPGVGAREAPDALRCDRIETDFEWRDKMNRTG